MTPEAASPTGGASNRDAAAGADWGAGSSAATAATGAAANPPPRGAPPTKVSFPTILLGVAALALGVAAALGRLPLLTDPLVEQANHTGGGSYSTETLALWGGIGVLAVWAYAVEAPRRPSLDLSAATLVALAPFLAAAPIWQALLLAGAFTPPLDIILAEPLIYATTAAAILLTGLVGWQVSRRTPGATDADRIRMRDRAIFVGGLIALAGALGVAWPRHGPFALFALELTVAAAALAAVVWLIVRAIPIAELSEARLPAAAAVFFGHALDGLTTWIGVRDPFGWGMGVYEEKNPASGFFLEIGNGWPFLVAKVVLPFILLVAVRDLGNPLHRRIAILAVFVLGFGPGAANAFQMALRG
ncbi:MAG: DUF63 family protein [Thermoplasmatota archaeon]